MKQETVSGSGISWAICKSAPRSRQITMPAPHQSQPDALPATKPTASNKSNRIPYQMFTVISVPWMVNVIFVSIVRCSFVHRQVCVRVAQYYCVCTFLSYFCHIFLPLLSFLLRWSSLQVIVTYHYGLCCRYTENNTFAYVMNKSWISYIF